MEKWLFEFPFDAKELIEAQREQQREQQRTLAKITPPSPKEAKISPHSPKETPPSRLKPS